jgi:hypothetical protein
VLVWALPALAASQRAAPCLQPRHLAASAPQLLAPGPPPPHRHHQQTTTNKSPIPPTHPLPPPAQVNIFRDAAVIMCEFIKTIRAEGFNLQYLSTSTYMHCSPVIQARPQLPREGRSDSKRLIQDGLASLAPARATDNYDNLRVCSRVRTAPMSGAATTCVGACAGHPGVVGSHRCPYVQPACCFVRGQPVSPQCRPPRSCCTECRTHAHTQPMYISGRSGAPTNRAQCVACCSLNAGPAHASQLQVHVCTR